MESRADSFVIRAATANHRDAWRSLRASLWPYVSADEHQREIAAMLGQPQAWSAFLAWAGPRAVGLVEAALRQDRDTVEPRVAAHVECWVVVPDWRRKGVGRALLAAAAEWGAARGADTLTSDVEPENRLSLAAHEATGFAETARLVHYSRPILAAGVVRDPRSAADVRPAHPGDVKEIAALAAEFSRYLATLGDRTGLHLDAAALLRDGFGPLPAFTALVAEQAGRVVGYLCGHPGYDSDEAIRVFYINDLFVTANARGRGIGTALMRNAAIHARRTGARELVWSVFVPNADALAFYRRLGGRVIDDLMLMVLPADAL